MLDTFRFPNPRFLAAWREHRLIYGYSLRAELVYQLKKALEQRGDFQLEGDTRHLLVDEYQDLNRCDLGVVHDLASRCVELFAAGDDDQSIYGFRKAHPEGIRRFHTDYTGSRELVLELCKRCDQKILDLGLFVARQDYRRIDKRITPEPGRTPGEVSILRFPNQADEAEAVARICRHLVDKHGLQPDDILVLLRSDRKAVFSNVLRRRLDAANLSTATRTEGAGPLDAPEGRSLLAFLRLAANSMDHLSWRTLLMTFCAGVGDQAIRALYELARERGEPFGQIVLAVEADPSILPSLHRNRAAGCISHIRSTLRELFPSGTGDYGSCDQLKAAVGEAAVRLVTQAHDRELAMAQLALAVELGQATSMESLVRATELVGEDIEQELEPGKINILTMHRAKGLTAKAVIVVAAEDEYLPGRAQGDAVDDERRLLYVSLTRAKHHLFVTYCDLRTGRQRYTGRTSGTATRSLTPFLRDGPVTPVDGKAFVRKLAQERHP
ncbi:MAG: ATP-dependent helicase [Acidobacteriota bacterium]